MDNYSVIDQMVAEQARLFYECDLCGVGVRDDDECHAVNDKLVCQECYKYILESGGRQA